MRLYLQSNVVGQGWSKGSNFIVNCCVDRHTVCGAIQNWLDFLQDLLVHVAVESKILKIEITIYSLVLQSVTNYCLLYSEGKIIPIINAQAKEFIRIQNVIIRICSISEYQWISSSDISCSTCGLIFYIHVWESELSIRLPIHLEYKIWWQHEQHPSHPYLLQWATNDVCSRPYFKCAFQDLRHVQELGLICARFTGTKQVSAAHQVLELADAQGCHVLTYLMIVQRKPLQVPFYCNWTSVSKRMIFNCNNYKS